LCRLGTGQDGTLPFKEEKGIDVEVFYVRLSKYCFPSPWCTAVFLNISRNYDAVLKRI
jgi:hypothetical protein